MIIEYIHTCQICGNEFTTGGTRAKYCPDCRIEGHERKRYDFCPKCGGRKFHAAKLCQKCYGISVRGGNSPHWKGGSYIDSGYRHIYCPNHPCATSNGYISEHRLVIEQKLGRVLDDDEVVHHINGIKTDNRPENLVAMTRNKHTNWTLLHIAQQRICELE